MMVKLPRSAELYERCSLERDMRSRHEHVVHCELRSFVRSFCYETHFTRRRAPRWFTFMDAGLQFGHDPLSRGKLPQSVPLDRPANFLPKYTSCKIGVFIFLSPNREIVCQTKKSWRHNWTRSSSVYNNSVLFVLETENSFTTFHFLPDIIIIIITMMKIHLLSEYVIHSSFIHYNSKSIVQITQLRQKSYKTVVATHAFKHKFEGEILLLVLTSSRIAGSNGAALPLFCSRPP